MTIQTGIGRLIVVLDEGMNPASIAAFGKLAQQWPSRPPLTVVAGARAKVVKAFGQRWEGLFYNPGEYVPMSRLMGMLPWDEIWIVKNGQVWGLREGRMLADLRPAKGPEVHSLSAARALGALRGWDCDIGGR